MIILFNGDFHMVEVVPSIGARLAQVCCMFGSDVVHVSAHVYV